MFDGQTYLKSDSNPPEYLTGASILKDQFHQHPGEKKWLDFGIVLIYIAAFRCDRATSSLVVLDLEHICQRSLYRLCRATCVECMHTPGCLCNRMQHWMIVQWTISQHKRSSPTDGAADGKKAKTVAVHSRSSSKGQPLTAKALEFADKQQQAAEGPVPTA